MTIYHMEHNAYPRYVTSLQDCVQKKLGIYAENVHYPLVRPEAPEVLKFPYMFPVSQSGHNMIFISLLPQNSIPW